jgi:hypothetical protein
LILAIVYREILKSSKLGDIFGIATVWFKIKKEGPIGLPHLAFLEYFL